MNRPISRRTALQALASAVGGLSLVDGLSRPAFAGKKEPAWEKAMEKGLKWVARTQSQLGHWTAASYPTAMTALGGTALICSGSTTTQGPYAKQIRKSINSLRRSWSSSSPNTWERNNIENPWPYVY